MPTPIYSPTAAQVKLVQELSQSIKNAKVLQAMSTVPRHRFIASGWSAQAYTNAPLPIGFGQTISQPLVVARITELALDYLQVKPRKTHKVLEIGAGCGYQAAILQHCFREVYAIERDANLYRRTLENLDRLGYDRIRLLHKDGMRGHEQRAPYDAVIFSCALNITTSNFVDGLRLVLAPIFAQMARLSCLVVPAGSQHEQRLCFFARHQRDWELSYDLPVRFVACTPGVVSA